MDGDCGLSEFHVLVVDDSSLNRKVVEQMLKICCCKVTLAESGMRALECLGLDAGEESKSSDELKLKVDMIITDYDMPGMTGFEVLKKIKGSSKIPVVIMSSENIPDRVDRCMQEGAERFLVKPVNLESLKDCIYKIKNIITSAASIACCSFSGAASPETKCKEEELGSAH